MELTDKGDLAKIFIDTENIYNNDQDLTKSIENTFNQTKVYSKKFRSRKKPRFNKPAKVSVNKNKTFQDAKEYIDKNGKDDIIAVLNFANAIHPGGGVRHGSRAQEESLCRCSTLYPCIRIDRNNRNLNDIYQYIYTSYYDYHRDLQDSTSRCLYSPDIVVFKDDSPYPKLMDKDDWFKVDVITCAANNQNQKHLNDDMLYVDMYNKAENIINTAIDNDVDVLILGAFGCGAFDCDPKIVSKAFKDVIDNYLYYFKEIRFAIFCSSNDHNYLPFEDEMNKKQ